MEKVATFLRFGRSSEQYYAELQKALFGSLDNTQVLILAMSYGFKMGRRSEEFVRGNNGARTALKPEHFALMTAIQISTDGESVDVMDVARRDMLAEEYAEGGIQLLHAKLADPNVNFALWLVSEIAVSLNSGGNLEAA